MPNFYELLTYNSGYQWNCNDWRNNENSDNILPNIVEGPGSETADSTSYHSDDSNEHKIGKELLNPNIYTEESFPNENYPEDTSEHLILVYKLKSKYSMKQIQILQMKNTWLILERVIHLTLITQTLKL